MGYTVPPLPNKLKKDIPTHYTKCPRCGKITNPSYGSTWTDFQKCHCINQSSNSISKDSSLDILTTIVAAEIIADAFSSDNSSSYDSSSSSDFSGGGGDSGGGGASGDW
jgi:uncharacterized membrane protein YgcG